jgi:hypothetical protein
VVCMVVRISDRTKKKQERRVGVEALKNTLVRKGSVPGQCASRRCCHMSPVTVGPTTIVTDGLAQKPIAQNNSQQLDVGLT